MAKGQRQHQRPTPAAQPDTESRDTEVRDRPARAHCLPQRYRNDDSREFIAIDQELEVDADDEDHKTQENHQPQPTAIRTATSDPFSTIDSSQGQSRHNVAHDTRYFFRKEETHYYCNICK
ncbi:hypothetical protein PISMIDRAFT_17769 [Pisolithus microcarpus 441]|uniref:Uncharacterized protein n=1 Tax=Pisolithus microcarpus 441 TaxID=765257 RepID=A0A0C9YIY2_9AGAM|nr:hypothetical protein PISMIDRAFT_17769 [Pisolithus microcarpus 441]